MSESRSKSDAVRGDVRGGGEGDGRDVILVVDDETSALRSVSRTLRTHGLGSVITCEDARQVMSLLEEHSASLVVLDLIMPHIAGEEILEKLHERSPDVSVIVLTAKYDVGAAVRCMKLGADDYLLKPVEPEHLVCTVTRSLEQRMVRQVCTRLSERFLSERLDNPETFSEIKTGNPRMVRLFAYLESVSRGMQPVLITGETGTGKELFARALHRASGRGSEFIAVNVAGLDDNVFSDTLFGHRRGAFTGASSDRVGMAERAAGGTLFLDEIGDLSEASQVKLLRMIQEREYYPLGVDEPRQLRCRIVAATHRDPADLRQDLYYRLRSYHLRVPPLRERLDDVPLVIDHFLEAAAADLGKPKPTVPGELFLYLSNYDFPGNLRELQSMVFDAVARHEGGVMPIQLFLDAIGRAEKTGRPPRTQRTVEFPYPLPTLRQVEEALIDEALRRVQRNQSAAAKLLGVSRTTVNRHVSRTKDD